MKFDKHYVINMSLFQIGWFVAILYKTPGGLACLLFVLCHLLYNRPIKTELMTIIPCALLGILVDHCLVWSKVFVFIPDHYPLLPMWMMSLWLLFATTLQSSMRWVLMFPWPVVAGLGSVFGALAYLAGYKLGAVDFTLSTRQTGLLLMVIWAALFPALMALARRLKQ